MVYDVYKNGDDVNMSLLTSKPRITPLKYMTMPSLELMAPRIIAQLMQSVKKLLNHMQGQHIVIIGQVA